MKEIEIPFKFEDVEYKVNVNFMISGDSPIVEVISISPELVFSKENGFYFSINRKTGTLDSIGETYKLPFAGAVGNAIVKYMRQNGII